jgi:hypothetical protein
MKSSVFLALLAHLTLVQACGSDEPGQAPSGTAGASGAAGGGGASGGGGSSSATGGARNDAGEDVVDGGSVGSDALDETRGTDADGDTPDISVGTESGSDADAKAADQLIDSPIVSDRPEIVVADAPDAIDVIDSAASDVADLDAETGPWTPAQLPNLALWLDAEVSVGTASNAVLTWTDRSGHGHVATEALADRRPSLVPSALNGHSVIRFDGQNDSLAIPDAESLRWGTGDFTIELVGSFTNATNVGDGYGLLFAKQNTDYPYPGPAMFANYPVPLHSTTYVAQLNVAAAVPTSTAGFNDGKARLYGARREGTTLEVRVNGAISGSASVAAVDISAPGQFVFVGGQQTSSGVIQALQGDVAEIVAIGGTTSASDRAKLEAYLKTKYGL